MNTERTKTIHRFTIKGINGNLIDFSDYSGKKILLVNVASECGLTPQYLQLQELYNEFNEQLVIIGCPANNFGGQEPGTDEEIEKFCSLKFSVSFPLTTKISVKGDNMAELYKFVTFKDLNGFENSEVSWNFQKYLFNEQGILTHIFSPQTEPADEQILSAAGISL